MTAEVNETAHMHLYSTAATSAHAFNVKYYLHFLNLNKKYIYIRDVAISVVYVTVHCEISVIKIQNPVRLSLLKVH